MFAQVTIRELDGTMDHALHIGRQPLVLGKFKIATRPSAWARRPKRKPQPGEDTALFTESDGGAVCRTPFSSDHHRVAHSSSCTAYIGNTGIVSCSLKLALDCVGIGAVP